MSVPVGVLPAALAGHAAGRPPSDVLPAPPPEVLDPLEAAPPVEDAEAVDPPDAVEA
jgi:hypothetical protein